VSRYFGGLIELARSFHYDAVRVVLVQWRRGRKLVVWPPTLSQARPLYPRRLSGS
jgi:hypothetical protein